MASVVPFMRLFLSSSAVFTILGAAFWAGPAYSQAKPDFTGTWKLNLKNSDFGTDPAPDSLVVRIQHKNGLFKSILDGAVNGQDIHEELEVPIDGKPHPGPGDFPGTMTMKWDGPALVFELKTDDGTIAQKGRFQLSGNGKVATRDVDARSPDGKEGKRREVYDRQ